VSKAKNAVAVYENTTKIIEKKEASSEMTEQLNVVFTRFPYESSYGGEEGHTMEIASFYRSQGAKVIFWGSCKVLHGLFSENGYKVNKKRLSKPPVTLFRLMTFSILSPLLLLKGMFDVLALKLKHGLTLRMYMLSFTEKLIYAPWCWLFGIKCIWLEHARFGNWFHKNPWKLWYQFWSKRENVEVITVSELMKTEMKMPWVKVITNAIDGRRFKKIKDASSLPVEMRRAFARKNFDIGFVGRFSEDKGVKLILKAAEEIPEAGFICCGNGRFKKTLDKKDIDNMWLDKKLIPCFMQNIDLLVLPATDTDPFGLVVLEAMHAGTPVLMTNKCGVSFHLSDGENAFICSPEKFVEKCKELVENREMLKRVKSNLSKALEEFSYDDMQKAYWETII
jgi:glycosyltransferase involved in cell wall biosynthesis